jgi:hypothetical protein
MKKESRIKSVFNDLGATLTIILTLNQPVLHKFHAITIFIVYFFRCRNFFKKTTKLSAIDVYESRLKKNALKLLFS